MKKILLTALIMLFIYIPLFGQTVQRQRVVVLPGTGRHPEQLTRAVNVTVELMERLGRFDVIDRRTTEQAMAELKLQLSGFLDENAVISLGNMMSSDIGMVIDLTNYKSEKNTDVRASLKEGELAVETRHDAVIEIVVRQFDINTTKSLKTISVMAEAQGKSGIEAEENAFSSIRSQLFERLKEFYPLLLTVREKQGGYIVVSGGSDIGVYKGMKFDVYPAMGSISRSGLVIVERSDESTAVAKILKGFSSIESNHIMKEKINAFPETAITAGLSRGYYYDDLTAIDFSVEFNTYNPLSGGLNFMLGISDQPVEYVRGNIFLTYKPVLADLYDFGIRGGLGATHFFGVKDEEGHSVMSQSFQLVGSAVSNFYLSQKLALFATWDYYIYPFKINDWYYLSGTGEEQTKKDAVGTVDEINLEGGFFTVGVKIIF